MKIDLYKDAESFAQSKRFTDWKKEFVKTDLYNKLEENYDYIFDWWDFKFRSERSSFFSPRHYLVSRITGLVGFYLIENYLDTTKKIIDVGCGVNYFNKYYDVHGVDPNYFPDADYEYEHYEDWNNYYNQFKGCYKNIMSQCALHFVSDIGSVLKDYHGLLEKGGKGFASLNLIRLYENDNSTSLTKQLDKLKTIEDIIEEVIVVEEPHASGLDGNLHIIFKSP